MNGNVKEETLLDVSEETLSIEVTTHCNNDCLHCFVRAGNPEPSSLPIDLTREIVSEGYDTGYRHLHITGGEPLLWKGLFEALDYAFRLGYKEVTMNTNGSLLTEDISSRLASYGDLSMSVSLDGPEALTNRIRGEGSYRRTVRGIENVLDAGIELVVFTTVCKSLLPELPHFADDLYRRFPTIKGLTLIQLIRANGHVFALSEELLEPDDFVRLVQTVSLLNLYGLEINMLNSPLAYVTSRLLDMPWIPPAPPLQRDGNMIVMANGSIRSTHSSRDRFGKYVPGMIQKVRFSDEYRKAVAPDETTCPSCKYAEPCTENGMVRPSEWYGESDCKVPYCERVLDGLAP